MAPGKLCNKLLHDCPVRPCALHGLDGAATLPGPSNMACVPVEVWESRTGVTVQSKRLRIDSGGAGTWRGGLG